VPQLALERSSEALGDDAPMTVACLGHLARACLAQPDTEGKVDLATSLLQRQVYAYEHAPQLQGLLAERCSALQALMDAYKRGGDTTAADEVSY